MLFGGDADSLFGGDADSSLNFDSFLDNDGGENGPSYPSLDFYVDEDGELVLPQVERFSSGSGGSEKRSYPADDGDNQQPKKQDVSGFPDLGEIEISELQQVLGDQLISFDKQNQLTNFYDNMRSSMEKEEFWKSFRKILYENESDGVEKICLYQDYFYTITMEFSIYSDPFDTVEILGESFKRHVIICPLRGDWDNNRTLIRFIEMPEEATDRSKEKIDRVFSVSKSKDESTTLLEYGTGLILYHLLKDVCPFFPKPEMLFKTNLRFNYPSIWKPDDRVPYEEPYMIATEPVITFEELKANLTELFLSRETNRVGKILKSILLQGLLAIRLLELKGFGSNGLNPSHIGFVKAKEEDDLSFTLNYPFGAEGGKGKPRTIDVFKDLDDGDKYILTFLMNPIKEDRHSAWNTYSNMLNLVAETKYIKPSEFEAEKDVEYVVKKREIVLLPYVATSRRKHRIATSTKEMVHGFAYAFTTLVLSISNGGDYSNILRDKRLPDGNTVENFLKILVEEYKMDQQRAKYIIEKTLLFGPMLMFDIEKSQTDVNVKFSTAVNYISKKLDIKRTYEESFKRIFPETHDSIYNELRKMSSWESRDIPSAVNIISNLTDYRIDEEGDVDRYTVLIVGENWLVKKKKATKNYPKYDWTNLKSTGGKFIGKRIPFGRFQIPHTPQNVKMSKLISRSLFSILRQRKRNGLGKMVRTTRKNRTVSPTFII